MDDEVTLALLANQLIIMELLLDAKIGTEVARQHLVKRIEDTIPLLDRLRQQQQYRHK